MRTILFVFLTLASCGVVRENESNKNSERDSIVFVVLSIQKDKTDGKHVIQLVSKTKSSGTIKKQAQNYFHNQNYLSVYLYNEKKLLNSIKIEHPLYKHLEYPDEKNNFVVKDTVLDKAEFFFRFQTHGNSNEIRISETLKDKVNKDLVVIKL